MMYLLRRLSDASAMAACRHSNFQAARRQVNPVEAHVGDISPRPMKGGMLHSSRLATAPPRPVGRASVAGEGQEVRVRGRRLRWSRGDGLAAFDRTSAPVGVGRLGQRAISFDRSDVRPGGDADQPGPVDGGGVSVGSRCPSAVRGSSAARCPARRPAVPGHDVGVDAPCWCGHDVAGRPARTVPQALATRFVGLGRAPG